LSGLLLIPEGFRVTSQNVIVDIGGVVKSFTLDSKGKSPKGNDSFAVGVKASKSGTILQVAKFAVKLSKGSFASLLTEEGLIDGTVSTRVVVPATIIFNEEALQKAVELNYKATKGKTGSAK